MKESGLPGPRANLELVQVVADMGMEKWFLCDDRDIRRIMRENLKKDRLKRMDAAWIEKWQGKL